MSVEKLERVLWRVRQIPGKKAAIHWNKLRLAVMKEIGTDKRTYDHNKENLLRLGWIKRHRKSFFILTDEDLQDE